MSNEWKAAQAGDKAVADELVLSSAGGAALSGMPLLWRDNGTDSIEIKGEIDITSNVIDASDASIILPDGYTVDLDQPLPVFDVPNKNGIPPVLASSGNAFISLSACQFLTLTKIVIQWSVKVAKA